MNRSQTVVGFGSYEADLAAGELRKNGVRVRLETQPFQILAMLLERPGEVVSREEIKDALWAEDTFVDFDNGLNTAIRKIRRALDDSATDPRYVETLPKRGYRFVGTLDGPGTLPSASSDKPRRLSVRGGLIIGTGGASLFRTTDNGVRLDWGPRGGPARSSSGAGRGSGA